MLNLNELQAKLNGVAVDGKISKDDFKKQYFHTSTIGDGYHYILTEEQILRVSEESGFIVLNSLKVLTEEEIEVVRAANIELRNKIIDVNSLVRRYYLHKQNKAFREKWKNIYSTSRNLYADNFGWATRNCHVLESEDEYQFQVCDNVLRGIMQETENQWKKTFKKSEIADYKVKATELIS